jgi:hypothetical protein
MNSACASEYLKPGCEIVFTVTDYYDGPRSGIANFRGKPHLYECIFDQTANDYTDTYLLTPVSDEMFSLAMEDWQIWKRWEVARAGHATVDSHPALPDDRARHEEIALKLQGITADLSASLKRIGIFEVLGTPDLPKGVIRPLQVRWTILSYSGTLCSSLWARRTRSTEYGARRVGS